MGGLSWGQARILLSRRTSTAFQMFTGGAVNRPHLDFHAFVNMSDRIVFHERFQRRPGVNNTLDTYTSSVAAAEAVATNVANKDFEVVGTGASADDITFHAEGGLLFTTDSSASQEVIVCPQLSTNQSAWTSVTWGSDQQTWWTTTIRTGAALADVHWMGLKLTNTAVIATDADQVFFRGGNSGNWAAVNSIAGTDVSTDTGVALAVDTDYRLAIIIDADRLARFYIDGALVATTAALTTAKDFIPYIGCQGNAKTMIVRHTAISRICA